MCDPITALTAIAATATVAGTVMNHDSQVANNKAAIQAANTNTATKTIAKTDQAQQAATKVFNSTLQPYVQQPPLQTIAPQQQQNAAILQGNVPPAEALSSGVITPNAPQVVQDSSNSDIASRLAKISASNTALGNLTGFDTTNQNQTRTLADAGSKIGTLGNFGQEDASIGSALTNQAVQNSQKPPSVLGDILTGIGSIGSFYAGKKSQQPSTPAPTGPF